jgi:hypothetical protein
MMPERPNGMHILLVQYHIIPSGRGRRLDRIFRLWSVRIHSDPVSVEGIYGMDVEDRCPVVP